MGITRQCVKFLKTVQFFHQLRCSHWKPQTVNFCSGNSRDDNNLLWWEEATVYVHWPYCQKRCTYCNFNKYIAPNVDQERMKQCLVTELQTLLELSGVKRVKSIFFGGGTPSLARPDILGAVIETADKLVTMPTDIEISMEANPTSLKMSRLAEFKSAGINRLSLGIQALNESDLRTLGRDHTVDQSLACIQEAKKLFIGRLSIDVIFGRPGQTVESWEAELDEILRICDDHVSLYQLTLEPGTLLYKLNQNGVLTIPDADNMAEMYEVAVRKLNQCGFHRYEVSNFARNSTAESQHNKAYWEGRQYIGIGPGAHGRFCLCPPTTSEFNSSCSNQYCLSKPNEDLHRKQLTSGNDDGTIKHKNLVNCNGNTKFHKTQNAKHHSTSNLFPNRESRIQTLEPEPWMWEVEKFGHGTRKRVVQSQSAILQELLLLGLRTSSGVYNHTWMQYMPGLSLMDVFGLEEFVIDSVHSGLITIDDRGLRCTDKGLNLLDSILPNLIMILNHYLE